jgi:hypothetical protein
MRTWWQVLAQTEPAMREWLAVVGLCAILLVLVVVLGIGLVWYRKRFVAGGSEPTASGPLTLGNLRDMLAAGQISQEEFDRLKATIIRGARASAGMEAPGTGHGAAGASDNPSAAAAGEQDETGGPRDAGESAPEAPTDDQEDQPQGRP